MKSHQISERGLASPEGIARCGVVTSIPMTGRASFDDGQFQCQSCYRGVVIIQILPHGFTTGRDDFNALLSRRRLPNLDYLDIFKCTVDE
ncbi:hypothetical protein AVEN_126048-1 [Araneus ventricosus]|uniref:Uncharacterized protein n=1 Tax=Araneus ventricosus TaxID=182803 RepID=A0A4Y2EV03_ARAVE|nr:hypothetical protein AVEN_126048-1 [Araneus ventricosus]